MRFLELICDFSWIFRGPRKIFVFFVSSKILRGPGFVAFILRPMVVTAYASGLPWSRDPRWRLARDLILPDLTFSLQLLQEVRHLSTRQQMKKRGSERSAQIVDKTKHSIIVWLKIVF